MRRLVLLLATVVLGVVLAAPAYAQTFPTTQPLLDGWSDFERVEMEGPYGVANYAVLRSDTVTFSFGRYHILDPLGQELVKAEDQSNLTCYFGSADPNDIFSLLEPCTSPMTFTDLEEGWYEFWLSETPTGHTSVASGYAFYVDPTPPEPPTPTTKDDCKNGGYEDYGYRNQGQCIKAVNQAGR